MAKAFISGLEDLSSRLDRLGRPAIRRIIEAGARVAADKMKADTQGRNHIRTGDMLNSIGSTNYRESLGGGSMEVYPQGDDRKGERNATKAFVTNYGRGGRRGPHSGDRFITGQEKAAEQIVKAAMQAEADKIAAEN